MVYRKPSPGVSALEAKLEAARVSMCRSEMMTLKGLRRVFDLRRIMAGEMLKNMPPDDPGLVICLGSVPIFTEFVGRTDDILFCGFDGMISFCSLYREEAEDAMEMAEKFDKLRGTPPRIRIRPKG